MSQIGGFAKKYLLPLQSRAQCLLSDFVLQSPFLADLFALIGTDLTTNVLPFVRAVAAEGRITSTVVDGSERKIRREVTLVLAVEARQSMDNAIGRRVIGRGLRREGRYV
ncbi:hypothetical protein HC762_02015 [bacterium]|nr:hypothetical protein [bacterium]